MFFVPRTHRGGKLVLYWKETMNLKVETSSKNHIDCIIGKGSEGAWRFTDFYDDFNEVLRGVEKKGGSNLASENSYLTKYGHLVDKSKGAC